MRDNYRIRDNTNKIDLPPHLAKQSLYACIYVDMNLCLRSLTSSAVRQKCA